MKLRFGDFELASATAELRKNGAPVSLEKQAFDLLLLLADNGERVLSKEEIIEKVWDGRPISDTSISTAGKKARRAVGDNGATQRVIKTVHGRGFRFVGEIKRRANVSGPVLISENRPPQSDTPSIAVLPFMVVGVRDGRCEPHRADLGPVMVALVAGGLAQVVVPVSRPGDLSRGIDDGA